MAASARFIQNLAVERISLALRLLCQQTELKIAFGDESVEPLLRCGEVAHFLPQVLLEVHRGPVDAVPAVKDEQTTRSLVDTTPWLRFYLKVRRPPSDGAERDRMG